MILVRFKFHVSLFHVVSDNGPVNGVSLLNGTVHPGVNIIGERGGGRRGLDSHGCFGELMRLPVRFFAFLRFFPFLPAKPPPPRMTPRRRADKSSRGGGWSERRDRSNEFPVTNLLHCACLPAKRFSPRRNARCKCNRTRGES